MARKLYKKDSERIINNFRNLFERHMARNDIPMALKTIRLALWDLWVSSEEYRVDQKREKISKYIQKYNFETEVKDSIDVL